MGTQIYKTRTETISKSDAFRMFDGQGNYTRIAKKYIQFLIDNDMEATVFSRSLFLNSLELSKGSQGVYKTAVTRFLDVCDQFNVIKVKEDTQLTRRKKLDHSLDNYVLLFLSEAEVRQSSKNTYHRALNEFVRYVELNGLPVSKGTVTTWKEDLRNRLSPYTVNVYLSAVRQFAKFIVENPEKIFKDTEDTAPVLKELNRIALVKKVQTDSDELIKDTFSKEEMKELLSIKDQKTRLIIALMYYAGLRTVEVVRLQVEDVKLKYSVLDVLGKGRDVKTPVQLNDQLKTMLKKHIGSRKEGQLIEGLTTAQIRKAVNTVLNQQNMKEGEKKRSCHSFRHTFCVHLIEAGVPIHEVQVLARHKSISTTEGYLKKIKTKTLRKQGITNILSI